jgi:hypothetical protein
MIGSALSSPISASLAKCAVRMDAPADLSRNSFRCLVAALCLLGGGCGPSVLPLVNTHSSPSSLANAVLNAFERRDLNALRTLAISEQEFHDHLWPELPSARTERNLPFSYVWGDLHQKSEAALGGTLASRGGQHYDLVGVHFLGGTTQYKSYLVHRQTALTVKDPSGYQQQLRLFGSILEKDGKFKIFSYVLD